ncbi:MULTISPECIES: sigma-54 dependent transcriptional regulator [unclassified Minwuia]|uniref:sigma-54-dependent transcriptional regulator n=1 Tax=unclassified Minwuia TaxID=2618799 RepID=UPI0024783EB5|nr:MULTISPECIES: sigma-54 dependent transcriptional regulator [unclassified Minwuia]
MTDNTPILMVEDDPASAMLYEQGLLPRFRNIAKADTLKQARQLIGESSFGLMILDVRLPDGNGLDLLREMTDQDRLVPTIVLTGQGSVKTAVDAMHLGAMDFIVKPCSPKKLREACEATLARRQRAAAAPASDPVDAAATADAGAAKPKRGPSGFLGESAAMKNVFALIEASARSDAPVFITGESGTGKELCASAIHNTGERRNGPFVAINCAAIPRELMESSIFGHRKGAFTGAISDHVGAAEEANGGTLFLDEICEMDLDLQAKLLRFIQTGTYRRVGDSRDRPTDIRFVCATNKDPLDFVQRGKFREDLYYRLHVVPIEMPPLRERATDMAMLARRFLRDYGAVEKKSFRDFTDDTMAMIQSYPWPGNVRQLENVVRNIVVLHDGELVTPEMLPRLPQAPVPQPLAPQPAPGAAYAPQPMPAAPAAVPGQDAATTANARDILVRPLVELEMMAIDAAIEKFDGNITQAARALDISTSTIYRKQMAWEKRKQGK